MNLDNLHTAKRVLTADVYDLARAVWATPGFAHYIATREGLNAPWGRVFLGLLTVRPWDNWDARPVSPWRMIRNTL